MNMQALRALAAVMDHRVGQLEAAGITGDALIERMVGHLPDLQQVWAGADDQQLAMLCQDYPGFYQYASLMEAAAEAQRARPPPSYLDIPELNDALKPLLAALLTEAATLERSYQVVIDATERRGMGTALEELNQRHRNWLGERERFEVALKASGVQTIVLDVVGPALAQIAERIVQLETRALARWSAHANSLR